MADMTPNILVVDDVADWRTTFRGLLKDEGHHVTTAQSIQEATALLENNKFDLAVIDIRLDEMNEDDTEGITLAKVIDERWPEIQVIIITGYETVETMMEAMKPRPGRGRLVYNYILKKDTTYLLIPEIKRAFVDVSTS